MARLNLLRQGRVKAFIRTQSNPILTPITFLIDTGASYTCLLPSDVIRLEIPYDELEPSPFPSATALGEVRPRLLRDIKVYLTVIDGGTEQLLILNFETMRVITPVDGYSIPPPSGAYSLLGMDVLRLFTKWSFEDDWLILET